MVFDIVDNASQYNMPMSLHRLFKLRNYRPGELVLSPQDQRAAEAELYARWEKPAALLDWPVDATDYSWWMSSTGRTRRREWSPRWSLSAGQRAGGDHRAVRPGGKAGP